MSRFAGKKVVITGGSSGIGLATAKRIAAEGGELLVTGTNEQRLADLAASEPSIHVLKNDARDLAGSGTLGSEARRLFGTIDAAFLNAGTGAGGSLLGDITVEAYRNSLDLNLGGMVFAAQALAPLMQSGGSILMTSSTAKDRGFMGAALYSASKGAVRALARALACELAPKGIRVNALSPGPTDTDFFARLGLPQDAIAEMEQALRDSNPLGRMGSAEDVAAVATFLLSEEARFVTGSDYAVDGGQAQL